MEFYITTILKEIIADTIAQLPIKSEGCSATSTNQIVQGVDNGHYNSKSREKYVVDSLSFTYLVFADIHKLTNQTIFSSCFLARALQYLDGMTRLPPWCPQILSKI